MVGLGQTKMDYEKKNSEKISKYMNELNKIKNMAQPTKIKTSGINFFIKV